MLQTFCLEYNDSRDRSQNAYAVADPKTLTRRKKSAGKLNRVPLRTSDNRDEGLKPNPLKSEPMQTTII
jgi:hypothetical protein